MGRPKKEKVYSVEDLHNSFAKEFRENRKIFNSIRKDLDRQQNKNLATLQECAQTLDRICKLNEEIEATICNVMIAIKQNSYLQAWYPEQQGIDEGNFSGAHPIVQKRIERRYADSNTR